METSGSETISQIRTPSLSGNEGATRETGIHTPCFYWYGGQGAEAAMPTQEIWEEYSVIVLAAAALLFLGDPLATV